jgi:hypothetical protein
MKRILLFVIFTMIIVYTQAQVARLNLDFEHLQNNKPVDWFINNLPIGYIVSVDSVVCKSGKYSLCIESDGTEAQPVWLMLTHIYEGKEMTLSGYIRTEDVSQGEAVILVLEFLSDKSNNRNQSGLEGTNDWTKCEISLPLNPTDTEIIYIGAALWGSGKMWIDDLSITIDGKDITEAKIYKPEPKPANFDKEFDSGSGIMFPALNDQLISDLELLGKVWGFLKYHHPEVAKGNYNWDYELFRVLPEYLKTKNTKIRDKVLMDWIGKYGKIKPHSPKLKGNADAYIKPNLSWVDNSDMSKDLKKKLHEIYTNRNQGKHYYIKMERASNPNFQNENPYTEMTYPDTGFRLLALYRYWNMIEYFFPYKYQTDKDWNYVQKEYIPIFLSVENRLEYELASIQCIGEVCDTHAGLHGGRDAVEELWGKYYAPSGGLETCISGIGVYYPDRTQTQRIGIVPDIWIEPTIERIRQGRDELLEKAIEIINEDKNE